MRNAPGIHATQFCYFALFCCLSLFTLSSRLQAQRSPVADSSKADRNRHLLQAVREGAKAKVITLLDQGADINAHDKTGRTPLQWAIEYGRDDLLELLRRRGASVGLLEAAALGELSTIRKMLEEGANVNLRDREGRTTLSLASRRGFTEIVQLLLDRGADLNLRDKEGWTALMRTVPGKHSVVIRLLRNRGANMDDTDLYGRTALMLAANNGNDEAITLLLDNGANPNARDKRGLTALMWDVSWTTYDMIWGGKEERHLAIARTLRDRGAQLNARDNAGMTALMHALWWDHPFIAAGLLDLGAGATLKDHQGRTALTLDARLENRAITRKLVKCGARIGVLDAILRENEKTALALLKGKTDLRERGPYGETPLIAAAEMGYPEVVRALLKQGANPNEPEEDGLTPLILALGGRLEHGQIGLRFTGDPNAPQRREIVRDLVQAGAKLNTHIRFRDRFKTYFVTPLEWAITISPLEDIRFLLDSGADVNLAGDRGITPLMTTLDHLPELYLHFKPRPEVTQWLLDRGADVNREDAVGKTALMYCFDDQDMIRKLLDRGANLKHRNHRGQTVLALAAERDAQTLEWLLAQGMDIHERDRYGWTLLTYAALNGDNKRVTTLQQQGFQVSIMDAIFMHDAAKVSELLDKGENPNRREAYDRSLLVWAVDVKDAKIVEILLKHGADVRLKSHEGIAALIMAQIVGRDDIKEMLERAGAE